MYVVDIGDTVELVQDFLGWKEGDRFKVVERCSDERVWIQDGEINTENAALYYLVFRKVEYEQEHTGGSVSYYKVEVKSPTTFEQAYWAECNDIIEALDMNYAEGNAFKAIWRRCAERQGKKKKGNNTFYDAEKIVFFAQRILEQEKEKQ